MTRRLHLLLAAAAILAAVPAGAAERGYTVTDFNKIRLQGPYVVKLTTGVAPFARAKGDSAALDSVAMEVNGRVLTIRRTPGQSGNYSGQPAGPVEIEIGTHEIGNATIVGAGSLDISAVRGLSFTLSLEGSGSARIASVDVDQLKFWLAGTGSGSLAGNAKSASLIARGTSSLDASALNSTNATITGDGPATVRATVITSAKVDARGATQILLQGAPACTVSAAGSATVTGCK